ncbi:unnamed protein product [Somion occarium]|uniref:GATA-type domain-containing protein n=1 Tax=Somion occarium TaxID=3059160 RepID=A0ABP1D1A9_9APHY
MDALHYDYTSYSDASTPRTPSPRTDMHPPFHSPHNFKPQVDIHLARSIFDHHGDDNAIVPETHALEAAHMWSHPYPSYPQAPGSRGSLLDELYENDLPEHNNIPHDVHTVDHHYHHSADPQYHGGNWSNIPQTAHAEHHHIQSSMRHAHDVAMTRRATFPYVRHDRPEVLSYSPHPFMGGEDSLHSSPYNSRPGTVYGEPLPMDGSPHMHVMRDGLHHLDEPFAHSVPMPYDHLDGIKTEDSASLIVPSQAQFCRPPSAGMHPLPCLSPHAGLLVQHTDDAASKETQYLRRRCFNCHTTEPPSWRRSTLNPGKIVCNKCGLYERTHLRPRPLRFDELRAGSKTRKQPKVAGGAASPKAGKLTQMVKKEPRDGEEGSPMIQRRSSVSSSAGSVHSGSATSDWDDNGSAPPSSFNSPAVSSFSIPRDPNSQSPPLPRDGGIRLPNAPLSDIASLQSSGSVPPTPRKAATAPTPFYHAQGSFYPNGTAAAGERRNSGSIPLTASPQMQTQSPQLQAISEMPMPEVTGWQSVPMSDLAPSPSGSVNGSNPGSASGVKSRSNSLRQSVTAA